MKLAALQAVFQAHVLQGHAAIVSEIATDERIASALRLKIYTEGYAARLVEVLSETYPAVLAALGPARFARCVRDFARAHPSRFRSARAYGEALSEWLASSHTGPRARGMADLARFEWAVAGAFDAADAPALTPASLAGVEPAQWPTLRFSFSPTVRRLCVSSNCVAWWKFACAEQPRPSRWRSTCVQQWLVWRQELAVFYRPLPLAEMPVLDAALAGQTFGELCEQVSGPAAAATLLRGWFDAGLIVEVSYPP
ncbi:MAG: DNA-binding domain-containing protein [Steroidobacteraceae bacterium]